MTRTSWKDLQSKKLGSMTIEERKEYDQAYAEAQLAAEVGERIHAAREAAGLTQRELARRMGIHKQQVERLMDIDHASRIEQLEAAFAALQMKLTVDIQSAADLAA